MFGEDTFVYGEDTFVFGEDTFVYGENILGRSRASASPIARAFYQLRGPKIYWCVCVLGVCRLPLTNIIW